MSNHQNKNSIDFHAFEIFAYKKVLINTNTDNCHDFNSITYLDET